MSGRVRIFFATDIHGSERCFRKFINAAEFYGVDVLILGGDISGKVVIPIVEQADHGFKVEFLGETRILKTEEEVERVEELIRERGYYPYRTSPSELKNLSVNRERVKRLLTRLVVERVKKWIELAEEHLKNSDVEVYITGGNDDPVEVEEVLKRSEFVVNPEGEVVKIRGFYEMVSTGYSNPTPWKTPREVSEEKLAEKIEDMVSQVENLRNCIFNIHPPPKDSGIDECPMLDTSVTPPKPVIRGGVPLTFGAGSTAVRSAIEKHQPLLGLHGHIHEARGVVRIGRTLCINPGSEYESGILRGAVIVLEDGRIRGYQLTSG